MGVSPSRWFETQDDGDTMVVRFNGATTLDEATSQAVGADLDQLGHGTAGRKWLLDFSNVTYLASGALAMLLTLHKKVREAGGQLVLANLEPKLHEVFEITQLNKLLEIGLKRPPGAT